MTLKYYQLAKKKLEELMAKARGRQVVLRAADLCRGEENAKVCGDAIWRLCMETPGCYKRRQGRYVFPVARRGVEA